jgi:rod shape determining protein RodA
MGRSWNFWRQFDWVLFATTVLLIVFGILMISSATRGAIDPDLISRVPDQIQYAVIGIGLMFVLAAVDYRLLGGLHIWLYIVMVGLLLLVRFLGVEGDAGSQRWINLGIRIQPSEIGKILIIITLGHYLSSRYQEMGSLKTVFGSLLHIAIPAGLIFIQPNLGTTIVFGVIWFTLAWSAGLRLKHITMFLLVLLIAAVFNLLLAACIGFVTLRLKGIYFAILTFGLAELLSNVILFWETQVTGTRGRFVMPREVL